MLVIIKITYCNTHNIKSIQRKLEGLKHSVRGQHAAREPVAGSHCPKALPYHTALKICRKDFKLIIFNSYKNNFQMWKINRFQYTLIVCFS